MSQWSGWLFFQSALSDGTCYGLNVQGATPAAGTPIILWPWQGGLPNELWLVDDDGYVVSMLGDNWVLGLGPIYDSNSSYNYVVLQQQSTDDETQMWAFQSDGTIANKANPSVVLDVAGGVATAGASIITYSFEAGPAADEVWWPAPVVPMTPSPPQYFIQSGTGDSMNTYGLSAGTKGLVTLASWNNNQTGLLWSLTAAGNILSALSPAGNLALALGLPASVSGTNHVIIAPFISDATGELWSQSDGAFVNQKTQQVLTVQGGVGVDGAAIIAAPAQAGPPAAQSWTAILTWPLGDILVQAPVPFPPFTGEASVAYDSICTQLDLEDPLRSQYVNLDAALAAWQTDINDPNKVKCPPDVDEATWDAVIGQLNLELTAAQGVQSLFTNYLAFHTAWFSGQSGVVTTLGTDAQMESSDPVGGNGLAIFSSALYTLLNLANDSDFDMSVVSNVLSTAMTVGLTAGSMTPISPDPFEVAYSDLWNQLTLNFTAAYNSASDMSYVILSDWGKLQTTYSLTTSSGVGGLSWPASLQLSVFAPSFTCTVMQMLMPAKYMLWYRLQGNGNPVSGVPSYAQYIDYIPAYQAWYATWITAIADDNTFPSQTAMNDIFVNGKADPEDFWYGTNGWNFTIQSATEGAAARPAPWPPPRCASPEKGSSRS